MTNFKLKSGIRFIPQDDKFIVLDDVTRSTYRVGQYEHLVLKQLKDPINVEEICYNLNAQQGIRVPYKKINDFIHRGIALGLVEVNDASVWTRMARSGPFALRMRFFDPTRLLDWIIRNIGQHVFLWQILTLTLLLTATAINLYYLHDLWTLRSFRIPAYGPVILLFIYLASCGHEMTHGLTARWYGFDVPEVGFHMHYFLPSFYCKILTPRNSQRNSLIMIFLSGSLFDLLVLSALVLIWLLIPGAPTAKEMIAFAVSLIWVKVLLIQLNPFLPLSDGYRVLGLLLNERRK